MRTPVRPHQDAPKTAGDAVRVLYRRLLESWNTRDATAFAARFSEDGEVIGCAGSEIAGPAESATTPQQLVADHVTATSGSKVRSVRLLQSDVAVLRARVGMTPPGQADLTPAVNAQQTRIAVPHAGTWRITLFQTTPDAGSWAARSGPADDGRPPAGPRPGHGVSQATP